MSASSTAASVLPAHGRRLDPHILVTRCVARNALQRWRWRGTRPLRALAKRLRLRSIARRRSEVLHRLELCGGFAQPCGVNRALSNQLDVLADAEDRLAVEAES